MCVSLITREERNNSSTHLITAVCASLIRSASGAYRAHREWRSGSQEGRGEPSARNAPAQPRNDCSTSKAAKVSFSRLPICSQIVDPTPSHPFLQLNRSWLSQLGLFRHDNDRDGRDHRFRDFHQSVCGRSAGPLRRINSGCMGPWEGLIALAGAFIYAELASQSFVSGGQYIYLREAFHPALAFTYGWSLAVGYSKAAEWQW